MRPCGGRQQPTGLDTEVPGRRTKVLPQLQQGRRANLSNGQSMVSANRDPEKFILLGISAVGEASAIPRLEPSHDRLHSQKALD